MISAGLEQAIEAFRCCVRQSWSMEAKQSDYEAEVAARAALVAAIEREVAEAFTAGRKVASLP